jgi:hypothetical protein
MEGISGVTFDEIKIFTILALLCSLVINVGNGQLLPKKKKKEKLSM